MRTAASPPLSVISLPSLPISRGLDADCSISPHLPTSPHISPSLPISVAAQEPLTYTTPDAVELSSRWKEGETYTFSFTATSNCSTKQPLAFEGGGDDYFEFGIFPGLTPRFYSLTEEVKLKAPGEGKSLPFGGLHALRKNEEACSITLTAISALNAAACDPEPASSD